jgi:hypothetical protein
LKIPVGLDLGTSVGLTLAQRPESLPELVQRFRVFVADVTRAYDNVVLIGIDELDKLKTAQQAESFLNGLKSVFGISGCFYLISVSENALASFERRGIGFRDAFDSALDDVLQLDFLDLDQARSLLNRRILRLPDPFLQVCHMLSGGLPRDLIRQARSLLDIAAAQQNGIMSLRTAVDLLTTRDLAARVRATGIAIRSLKELPETSALLIEIASLPIESTADEGRISADLKSRLIALEPMRASEEGRTLLRYVEELLVYFDMTRHTRGVAKLMSLKKGWKNATELGLADMVASVRQALEVSVPLAEMRLKKLTSALDRVASEPGNATDQSKVPRQAHA